MNAAHDALGNILTICLLTVEMMIHSINCAASAVPSGW